MIVSPHPYTPGLLLWQSVDEQLGGGRLHWPRSEEFFLTTDENIIDAHGK